MKILRDEQKAQALLRFNPVNYATNIPSGGSKGGREERSSPPRGSKFFQFHAVFGKFWQNRMLTPPLEGWRSHLGEMLDPPLIPLYKSPILLSFLCLLVREDDIDLSRDNIDTGEIYARMLRCLYTKFTIRKGIEFKASEFVRVMKLVGKLAFETLVTGKSLLQRSEVIEEVGTEAFDYGLLIGHEDFRLIRGESEDILVTFPHRSIQEFLGSLYFVLMLIEGVSYKTLLGKHSQRPIFMMNPLFLQFCMWLLHSDKGHFNLQNTADVSDQLALYVSRKIASEELIIQNIRKVYPALNIYAETDTLASQFLASVIRKCNMTKILTFAYRTTQSDVDILQYKPVMNIVFKSLRPLMQNLLYVHFPHVRVTCLKSKIVVNVTNAESAYLVTDYGYSLLHVILDNCRYLTTDPCLFIYSKLKSHTKLEIQPDLTTVREIHLTEGIHLTSIHNCQSLSQISASGQSSTQNFIATLQLINEPLSNLRSLRLFDCGGTNVSSLQRVKLPGLKDLRLHGCALRGADTARKFAKSFPNLESIGLTINETSEELIGSECISTWQNTLAELFLEFEDNGRCSLVLSTLTDLPNLTELGLSLSQSRSVKQPIFPEDFDSPIESLTLHRFIISGFGFKNVTNIIELCRLRKLDLSHTSNMSWCLSVFTREHFPVLKTLILSDCGMNALGLCTLAKANLEGRLPELRTLDISRSRRTMFAPQLHISVESLFHGFCSWNQLYSLSIRDVIPLGQDLNAYIRAGYLASLQELSVTNLGVCEITTSCTQLQKLCISGCGVDTLNDIADSFDRGFLPALHTVCIQSSIPFREFIQLDAVRRLIRGNIWVHEAQPGVIEHPFQTSICVCHESTD